jgi:hypothetical protein
MAVSVSARILPGECDLPKCVALRGRAPMGTYQDQEPLIGQTGGT